MVCANWVFQFFLFMPHSPWISIEKIHWWLVDCPTNFLLRTLLRFPLLPPIPKALPGHPVLYLSICSCCHLVQSPPHSLVSLFSPEGTNVWRSICWSPCCICPMPNSLPLIDSLDKDTPWAHVSNPHVSMGWDLGSISCMWISSTPLAVRRLDESLQLFCGSSDLGLRQPVDLLRCQMVVITPEKKSPTIVGLHGFNPSSLWGTWLPLP